MGFVFDDGGPAVLRVARTVETLLAEISCAQDRDEVCDLARRADETISALHRTIDRERLSERLADAVGERLQHFTADDPRAPAPVVTLNPARGGKSHDEKSE